MAAGTGRPIQNLDRLGGEGEGIGGQPVAARLFDIDNLGLQTLPLATGTAQPRQLDRGLDCDRRRQGAQGLGAGGGIAVERRQGVQKPLQSQREHGVVRLEVQGRHPQTNQIGQKIERPIAQGRDRSQVDQNPIGGGFGQNLSVPRVEDDDQAAVQGGLCSGQNFRGAGGGLGPVGQDHQLGTVRQGAKRQAGTLTIDGAQDVGVGRPAAAGGGGGPAQRGISHRVGAIPPGPLATIDRVGDGAEGVGQGLR